MWDKEKGGWDGKEETESVIGRNRSSGKKTGRAREREKSIKH